MDEMRKPKPYEVGVQISCGVHSEMPPQGFVQGTAAAFGGSVPAVGEAERKSRSRKGI